MNQLNLKKMSKVTHKCPYCDSDNTKYIGEDIEWDSVYLCCECNRKFTFWDVYYTHQENRMTDIY